MIEPEIAFADLADDADLAEALPEARSSARARTSADDLAFFESASRRA
jgi:aspartyl/asparaginyl-tRNA synthetase